MPEANKLSPYKGSIIFRSSIRGHLIIWVNGQWIYEDNHKQISPNGEIRPCAKCGILFPKNEVDPCLGMLSNVENACCGHGIRSATYISFKNNVGLWKSLWIRFIFYIKIFFSGRLKCQA